MVVVVVEEGMDVNVRRSERRERRERERREERPLLVEICIYFFHVNLVHNVFLFIIMNLRIKFMTSPLPSPSLP